MVTDIPSIKFNLLSFFIFGSPIPIKYKKSNKQKKLMLIKFLNPYVCMCVHAIQYDGKKEKNIEFFTLSTQHDTF